MFSQSRWVYLIKLLHTKILKAAEVSKSCLESLTETALLWEYEELLSL